LKYDRNSEQMPYYYWLASGYTLRSKTRAKLLNHAGEPRELYNMKKQHLQGLDWLTANEKVQLLREKEKDPLRLYERFVKTGGQFTWQGDDTYPKRLAPLLDAPFALFYFGELPVDERPSVGIVGARNCSAYGKAAAEQFGKIFAEAGVTVVSGMACGVDRTAQMAAVGAAGTSCAVLGCGIDICYPASSGPLYHMLRKDGCIVSEYPIGTPPAARNFPARNRIISGLSDKVLVIEAREKSGSLITADMALEQGKDVFALPGRVSDALSRGCNELIHQGAGIAVGTEQLLADMGFKREEKINKCENSTNTLAKDEKLLYSCVDLNPKSLEEIWGESGFSEEKTIELLIELQLKGYISETFRNHYVRTGLE